MRQIGAPQFMNDLFGDLRDRHLLPIAAVLVLGIAAVPFLLAGSAPEPQGPKPDRAIASEADLGGVGRVTVVSEDTQVRDYRKRLLGPEKNPFHQQFTAPQLEGSELGEASASTTVPTSSGSGASLPDPSGTSTSVSTGSSPAPPAGVTGEPAVSTPTAGTGEGETETKFQTVTYAVDVRIVRNGNRRTRRNARELARLPSAKVPVVMYMGASQDGRKAMFLVSDRVNSVFGDVRCLVGSESCQLLHLVPGLPVTFVYGANERRYRLKLLKIERVSERSSRPDAEKRD